MIAAWSATTLDPGRASQSRPVRDTHMVAPRRGSVQLVPPGSLGELVQRVRAVVIVVRPQYSTLLARDSSTAVSARSRDSLYMPLDVVSKEEVPRWRIT